MTMNKKERDQKLFELVTAMVTGTRGNVDSLAVIDAANRLLNNLEESWTTYHDSSKMKDSSESPASQAKKALEGRSFRYSAEIKEILNQYGFKPLSGSMYRYFNSATAEVVEIKSTLGGWVASF